MVNTYNLPKKNIKITFELFIYIFIFIIGLFLRFYKLGGIALSDHEAILALNALGSIQDNISTNNTGQVFLTNFMGVLFYLFGTSNFLARFLTALAGSLLVITPFLFKNYINHRFLIILSAWMAINPTLVALSRQTDGVLLFILFLILVFYFFSKKMVLPFGIFFSICLLSGEIFFLILIPIILTYLYVRLFSNLKETTFIEGLSEQVESFDWKKFGFVTVISYVLLSTFGFFIPKNFLGIGYGVQEFLASWTQISQTGLSDIVRGLIFYEIPVIIFGAIGIFYIFRKIHGLGAAFTGFIMISIIQIILLAEKNIIFSVFIILPLMISASYFISNFISFPEKDKNKIIIVTVVALAIIIFVNLAFMSMFSNLNLSSNELSIRIIFIIAGFGLIAGAGLLAGWALGWNIAGKSFLYLFLIYFTVLTISSTINAANLRLPTENEVLTINPHPIDADLIVKTLQDYSEWNYGEKNTINVFVLGSENPSLVWLLRDFENVSIGNVIPQNQQIDAIVTDVDQSVVQVDSFRGQKLLWTSEPTWSSMNANQFARWFLTRRAPQSEFTQQSKIIWIRNDLFPGSEN